MTKTLRDENGWHVPAEGTKYRRVYDLLKAGNSTAAVALLLEDVQSKNAVYVAAFKIKNPDRALASKQSGYANYWHPVDPRCKAGVEIFSYFTGFGVIEKIEQNSITVIAANGERVVFKPNRYNAIQYDCR